MTSREILAQLRSMQNDQTRKVLLKHGAREPFYGVKIADLKKIQRKIRKNHELAMELYNSGISDAMYLAGLIADEKKMSPSEIKSWLKNAYWYMLSEYTVPWVAAESNHGMELALEWIQSVDEKTCSAGWCTLSGIVALKPDSELDEKLLRSLLRKIKSDIHKSQNRVRYSMNNFLISVGTYYSALYELAIKTAEEIGKVKVDAGETSCKVPYAPEYIRKAVEKGVKKRKTVRC